MRLLSLYYHYNLSKLADASVTYFSYNVHPVDPYVSSLKVSCTILLLNARFQLQPYFIPCQQTHTTSLPLLLTSFFGSGPLNSDSDHHFPLGILRELFQPAG